MPNAYSGFEKAVRVAATKLRETFASHDMPHLHFTVTVEGPVNRDDLIVRFQIASGSWGDDSVKGATVDAVVSEFFRRKGWKQSNDYLAISYLDSHSEE